MNRKLSFFIIFFLLSASFVYPVSVQAAEEPVLFASYLDVDITCPDNMVHIDVAGKKLIRAEKVSESLNEETDELSLITKLYFEVDMNVYTFVSVNDMYPGGLRTSAEEHLIMNVLHGPNSLTLTRTNIYARYDTFYSLWESERGYNGPLDVAIDFNLPLSAVDSVQNSAFNWTAGNITSEIGESTLTEWEAIDVGEYLTTINSDVKTQESIATLVDSDAANIDWGDAVVSDINAELAKGRIDVGDIRWSDEQQSKLTIQTGAFYDSLSVSLTAGAQKATQDLTVHRNFLQVDTQTGLFGLSPAGIKASGPVVSQSHSRIVGARVNNVGLRAKMIIEVNYETTGPIIYNTASDVELNLPLGQIGDMIFDMPIEGDGIVVEVDVTADIPNQFAQIFDWISSNLWWMIILVVIMLFFILLIKVPGFGRMLGRGIQRRSR